MPRFKNSFMFNGRCSGWSDFLKWISWSGSFQPLICISIRLPTTYMGRNMVMLKMYTYFVIFVKHPNIIDYLQSFVWFLPKNGCPRISEALICHFSHSKHHTFFWNRFFMGDTAGWSKSRRAKFPPRKVTVHFVDPNHGIPRSGGGGGGWWMRQAIFTV